MNPVHRDLKPITHNYTKIAVLWAEKKQCELCAFAV